MRHVTGLPLTGSIARVAVPTIVLLYALAVTVTLARSGYPLTSYAHVGPLFLVLDRAAGLALIGAGVFAWFGDPRSRVGGLAMLAGVVWFGPDLIGATGAPDLIRSLGILMTPFILPLVLHLVVTATGRVGQPTAGRRIIPFLYGATAILTLLRVVTYLPFDERYCWAICTETGNVFVVGGGNAAWTRLLGAAWLGLATVAWSALALWSAWRLRHRTRAERARNGVFLAAVALGVAWACHEAILLVLRDERPGGQFGTLFETLFLARALGLVALAASLAWTVTWHRRRSAAVRAVADSMAAAARPASLEATLAHALRDDSLTVAFPIDDGSRFVDATGGPVPTPTSGDGRALTPIERRGRTIAVVTHDATLDSRLLEQQIGAAARLAVDNERLRAVVLAQVAELRASRSRIVEAGDAERRRLERDLHDGAQQRLLALSYEVRIARSAAQRARDPELARRLDRADALSQHAIEELRQLAHGIYPAVLADAGLGPALASLSDESTLPIVIESSLEGRLPEATEIAAYSTIADAVGVAARRGASYLEVRLSQEGDRVRLEITDDGDPPTGALVRAADRVGAAGGRLTAGSSGRPQGGSLISVELPCA